MASIALMCLELLRRDNVENRRALRRERVLRDPGQAFELPQNQFVKLFRLTRPLVLNLCERLDARLSGVRITALTVDSKILIALRFYATGSYQTGVGQELLLTVSQPTVSRVVKDVSEAIVEEFLDECIKFPCTLEEQAKVKAQFLERKNFPGVIGALDCTHVGIVTPTKKDEPLDAVHFFNRKGFYSINVQLICDLDLRILNVNGKFPGSTHDSFIWKSSMALNFLESKHREEGFKNSWVLGDAGYPLQPWLMVPISQPANLEEVRYNSHHKEARKVVERCNGVLKERFRCLLKDRILHYSPRRAAKIIYACCILHNICVTNKIPEEYAEGNVQLAPEDLVNGANDDNEEEQPVPQPPGAGTNWFNAGLQVRNRIIRHFR